jgi:hypothetical protein
MIIFLTEEPSIKPVLQRVMFVLSPEGIEGMDWIVISHQGKADLRSKLRQKMQSWHYGSPHFVILRDNDGGDCQANKQDLLDLAAQTGKPHHVRIVCQELEAWFIGDLAAVELAFPESRATQYEHAARFRSPDKVQGASNLIEEITGSAAKVGRANQIAPHMELKGNRSPSFQVLISTIQAQLN